MRSTYKDLGNALNRVSGKGMPRYKTVKSKLNGILPDLTDFNFKNLKLFF